MVFLDTNVLVYAIDLRDAPRGRHAPRHERRACDRGRVELMQALSSTFRLTSEGCYHIFP